jgi:hypothetical protein
MTRVVQHPECAALQEEIRGLREELASALAEIDALHTQAKPYLLALYQQKLGAAELECLRMQCRAEWLRRYIEGVQAARNRGKPVVTEAIEAGLRQELDGFWQRLRDSAEKLEAARNLLGHLMTPGDAAEFRKLYRGLVKRLHPDLNPQVGDRERLMWRRVQAAYTAGDLAEMRMLAAAVERPEASESAPSGLDALREVRQRLLARIRDSRERIESIEKQPPFDLKVRLADDAWVEQRRREIAVQQAQWAERIKGYEAHLGVLLGGQHGGFGFGFSAN